jgi:hypothetical protein
MLCSIYPFYSAVLEQYYTGEMILPVVNGIDDGSILLIFIYTVSGMYGCVEVWTHKVVFMGFEQTRGNWFGICLFTAS